MPSSPRLVRLLVAASSTLLATSVGLGILWRQAAQQVADPSRLSSEARQALASRSLEDSPGVHQTAVFEPRIGYTLRPNSQLTAWGDSFTTNALGYRAGPVAKPAGTYRVLFVGDSWTYGMGVRHSEAFPAVVERIARRTGAAGLDVETWNLALPGYNLINEITALRYFFDDLDPDAVVVVPSSNDNHGTGVVLPNGSLWRGSPQRDDFGAPHTLTYRIPFAESFEADRRWREAMSELQALEPWLAERQVPLAVLFLARWRPAIAHQLVAEAGIVSPYAVLRSELTLGDWVDPEYDHGTAAANERYAGMAYALLAQTLGWPGDAESASNDDGWFFARLPELASWQEDARRLREKANQKIEPDFVPDADHVTSAAGPIDLERGVIGRATTIQLRRLADSRRVRITLAALPSHPALYPLPFRASIPSPSGGTTARGLLGKGDSGQLELEIPIPTDVAAGAILDLVLETDRAAAGPDRFGEACRLVRVIQLGP